MNNLNIVDLIEKNPITKLSSASNNKLLNKIQKTFNGFEQQLFVSSFFCYLNYDKNTDFVIDLDDVWKWLGFQQKYHAKVALERFFQLDIDFKKTAPAVAGAVFEIENTFIQNNEEENTAKTKQNGGQNRQIVMLTIKCFKSLCLKAQTQKASEIHDYYIKMEDMLHEIIDEETNELRLLLEQKNNIILKTKKENQRAVEQATTAQFPVNTECIYFGTIDNTNEQKETLIKFGHTNDLGTRLQDHRKKYENFILVAAFRVQNKVEIENLIKSHAKIKRQIRSIEVKGKQKTEIIAYDETNFTIEKLTKAIKDIIHSKTYCIDNFNRMLKENEELLLERRELQQELEKNKAVIQKQELEIHQLQELAKTQKQSIDAAASETKSPYENALLPADEFTAKFTEFINKMCIVRQDVEEASTNMEGQFRIWSKTKPKKETFHALKNYLDTRFKPARISNQNKDQVVNGYIGVKLIEIEYKKKLVNDDAETFLFQVCQFSPNGKILNSILLSEYQRWKKSVGKECSDNDMKEIKEYLNSCEHAIKATVWTDAGSNEGYYGVMLKCDEHKHKVVSSTGKTVEKRESKTDNLLGTWTTIAKAAESEKISAAKMSRSIKAKVVFNNDYYYCTKQ